MSDLKSQLKTIQGVGDATAESVLEVLAEYDSETDPQLQRAIEYAKENEDRTAAVYLRRYAGES